MPVETIRIDPPFETRAAENREARAFLGKAAAARVKKNETIALDGGVTTEAMAGAMEGGSGVTVVTASVPVLSILMEKKRAGSFLGRVYFLGGLLDEREQMTGGALTAEQLGRFSFDRVFLSATAVDGDGIYMSNTENGELAGAMLSASREGILLAGSEKLGRRSVYRYAPLSRISELITDREQELPAALCNVLRQNGVRLTVTGKEKNPCIKLRSGSTWTRPCGECWLWQG